MIQYHIEESYISFPLMGQEQVNIKIPKGIPCIKETYYSVPSTSQNEDILKTLELIKGRRYRVSSIG